MSAETLREAAALMRERANVATPGPWVTGSVNPRTNGRTWFGNPNPEVYGPLGEAGGRDSMHIASWHPDVALAVADWLDESLTEGDPFPDSTHQDDCHCHACAVARAYLGVQR